MDNYEFIAMWLNRARAGKIVSALDYGCGDGKLVKLLHQSPGVKAFGCDVFYGGGDDYAAVDSHLLESNIVRRMDGNTIPFDNATFDFVTNNQVMEHVDILDDALAEIWRVLKPGGMVLSLFPDKGVWREGHCGVPFLHRFPKGDVRIYYAGAWRILGFGYHKGNKSVMRWSRDFCRYLDKWTYYRTRQEIDSAYEKYFCDIRRIEDYWLQQRLGGSRAIVVAALFPASIQKLIVRKLCGMVFSARKQF